MAHSMPTSPTNGRSRTKVRLRNLYNTRPTAPTSNMWEAARSPCVHPNHSGIIAMRAYQATPSPSRLTPQKIARTMRRRAAALASMHNCRSA